MTKGNGAMGILGIHNRTENWKTAQTFAPFFESPELRQKLAQRLGEPEATAREDVKLELFWKGVRDWLNAKKPEGAKEGWDKNHRKAFRRAFGKHFGQLRGLVRDHQRLTLPKDSYSSLASYENKLYSNLRNTEIDIVLETPSRIYIGEAKDEMGFGYDGDLVLVHQLIRQYVAANILLDITQCSRELVPFIVMTAKVNSGGQAQRKPAQLEFMEKHYGLKHILSWDDIDKITGKQS